MIDLIKSTATVDDNKAKTMAVMLLINETGATHLEVSKRTGIDLDLVFLYWSMGKLTWTKKSFREQYRKLRSLLTL